MGKVKTLVEEVREEISDLFFEHGDIPIEDVKQILKNKYFFRDNNNSYLIDDNLIEQLYEEQLEVNLHG